MSVLTRDGARIDDIDAVRGHEAALSLGDVAGDGPALRHDGLIVAQRFTAATCNQSELIDNRIVQSAKHRWLTRPL